MVRPFWIESVETLPKEEQILKIHDLLYSIHDMCTATPDMGEEFIFDESCQNFFYSYIKISCLLVAKVLGIAPTHFSVPGEKKCFSYIDHDDVNSMVSYLREEAFHQSGWETDEVFINVDSIQAYMASCEYDSRQEALVELMQDNLSDSCFPRGESFSELCAGIDTILSETYMEQGDITVLTFKNEKLGKLLFYMEEHELGGTQTYQDLKNLLYSALCPTVFYEGMFWDSVEDGCYYAYQVMFNNYDWNELSMCEVSNGEISTLLNIPLLENKVNELFEVWKIC